MVENLQTSPLRGAEKACKYSHTQYYIHHGQCSNKVKMRAELLYRNQLAMEDRRDFRIQKIRNDDISEDDHEVSRQL